jgi:hypothetical protein
MKKIIRLICVFNALCAYVNASIAADLDSENIAAFKIQDLFQSHLVNKIFEITTNEQPKIKNDRFFNLEANEYYFNLVRTLNDQSSLEDITIAETFCMADGKENIISARLQNQLKQYLQRQTTSQNKLRRQMCKMWLSVFFMCDHEKTHELLNELLTTGCTRIRAMTYQHLACVLEDSGEKEQALDMYLRGIALPKKYHGDTYQQIADLYRGSKFPVSWRKFYLNRMIKVGSIEQRAKGLFDLTALYAHQRDAEIHNPYYALNQYQSFLQDSTITTFIDPFKIHLAMLEVLTERELLSEPINLNCAIEICEHIYTDREQITPGYYWEIVMRMVQIYSFVAANSNTPISNDCLSRTQRMLEIAETLLNEPYIPLKYVRQISMVIANKYTYGPKGMQNLDKALGIFSSLRIELTDTPHSLDDSSEDTQNFGDSEEDEEDFWDGEAYENSKFMKELESDITRVKYLIQQEKPNTVK